MNKEILLVNEIGRNSILPKAYGGKHRNVVYWILTNFFYSKPYTHYLVEKRSNGCCGGPKVFLSSLGNEILKEMACLSSNRDRASCMFYKLKHATGKEYQEVFDALKKNNKNENVNFGQITNMPQISPETEKEKGVTLKTIEALLPVIIMKQDSLQKSIEELKENIQFFNKI